MKKQYTNLDELFKDLFREVSKSMKSDVSEVAKDEEVIAIQKEVFDAYPHPTMYERRKTGGIDDRANMKDYIDEDGDSITLTITNETPPSDGINNVDNLAGLIEFGDNNGYGEYDYKTNKGGKAYGEVDAYKYLNPRPFTEQTIESLRESGAVEKALKDSLNSKGIHTEG
jgi:hypothetical protein